MHIFLITHFFFFLSFCTGHVLHSNKSLHPNVGVTYSGCHFRWCSRWIKILPYSRLEQAPPKTGEKSGATQSFSIYLLLFLFIL